MTRQGACGPQGTLYGRNTPIGAININTRAPMSFWVSDRDGYEHNLANGKDINWMKSYTGSPEQLDIPQLATPGFLANSAALGTPLLNTKTGDHKVEEEASGLDTMEIAGASATFDSGLGWSLEGHAGRPGPFY